MISNYMGQYGRGIEQLQVQKTRSHGGQENKISFEQFIKKESVTRGADMAGVLREGKRAPYEHLADKDSNIEYKGVKFFCNSGREQLCLGNMENEEELLYISMEKGGCLRVNRENIGDLLHAIGMFSPEDQNRIMRSVAQDAKCQKLLREIDEDKNTLDADKTEDDKENQTKIEKE